MLKTAESKASNSLHDPPKIVYLVHSPGSEVSSLYSDSIMLIESQEIINAAT